MDRNRILIDAGELLNKLGDDNIRIYDATITNDVYLQEHIPGAAFFDHEKFSDPNGKYEFTVLPETKLAAQIGEIGISEDSEVILYACGMLPYAARAWWLLRYAGHNNVRVLNGGLSAWKEAGGKTEQQARSYKPSRFTGQIRPNMFVNKDDVLDALKDADISTVNVMPMESYEATHITGSICVSCMDLMDKLDSFLPDDQIALHLQEMASYKRIITYCGGGIAATVNAMAHLMIGYENVAVYDGSLYEWLGEGLPTTGTGNWEIWKKS